MPRNIRNLYKAAMHISRAQKYMSGFGVMIKETYELSEKNKQRLTGTRDVHTDDPAWEPRKGAESEWIYVNRENGSFVLYDHEKNIVIKFLNERDYGRLKLLEDKGVLSKIQNSLLPYEIYDTETEIEGTKFTKLIATEPAKSLFRHIEKTEKETIKQQLIATVKQMHDNSFVHGDIKRENVYMIINKDGNPEIRFGDFDTGGYYDEGNVLTKPLRCSREKGEGDKMSDMIDLAMLLADIMRDKDWEWHLVDITKAFEGPPPHPPHDGMCGCRSSEYWLNIFSKGNCGNCGGV